VDQSVPQSEKFFITGVHEPTSIFWANLRPFSPEVVGAFSAICYLTARDVSRMHTGSRPVGLIESDWGGTPVQVR
jgi:hypothetical protein